ncbi:MAG: LemA family protein [Clostridiales bacterium]|jgi:LemA protein|nr:LemA family protein [Clostridiales bacterium]
MIIAIIIIALILLFVIGMYNGLVQTKMRVENAFAQIDTQLQRRYDLIPNLVETVKGYMEHERETLSAVTEARASAEKAGSVAEKAEANDALSGALTHLFAVSENYPNLKANENFMSLQTELTNTENKISFSRQFYNDSATTYNTKIMVFPTNIIANMFNFTSVEYFKISAPEAKDAPKVQF